MKPTPSATTSVAAEVDVSAPGALGLAGDEVRRGPIVVRALAVGRVAGLPGAGFRVGRAWSGSLRTRSIHSLPGWRSGRLLVAIGQVPLFRQPISRVPRAVNMYLHF